MAIKLQIRRDTLANWTANSSVVLLEGEIGYVTDTRNMKIGDGTTVWSSLKYQAPYYTAANSGAPDTLLALKVSDSRVGIGTTAPAATLGVAGNIYIGNQTNSGTDGTLALISSGGLNYIQSGQNINATSAPLVIGAIGGGTNWMRVTSGGVGIGVTASPSNTLNIESTTPTIRLKDTTAANTAHCLIDANGDDGSVVIAADPTAQGAAASTVSLSVDNTTRLQATTTGVAITGTTTSSGALTVSTGGLTVSAGGATVTAGGLTVTTGTVSLPANSVSLGTVSQIAAGNFLGNSTGSTANIAAVTQAQARTMLGLIAASYTSPVTSNAVWTNTALSGSTTVNLDLDVTTLGIGVINRIPISLGRSGGSGNASVFCRAIVESGETLLIIGGFDAGSAGAFNGGTGTGIAWYWRNEVWISAAAVAVDSQQVRSVPTYAYTGANTVNVLKWNQITLTAPQVTAEVIAIRLS